MTTSEGQAPAHNPEQAWFSATFTAGAFGDSQYRLYVYPGTNAAFPADIRFYNPGDEHETVYEGEVRFQKNQLRFMERANVEKPDNPEWVCTLSAVQANERQYIGGPETGTGLFEPVTALKIAQMSRGSSDTPEGRALAAQVKTLSQRSKPVVIEVVQNEPGHSTMH